MGTVFNKTFTKPLPAGAELFTRDGHQFARWKDAAGKTRKALVTASKNGQARILIEAKTYTAKYRDGGRIVREVSTGCRDEQAARSVLAELERRAALVKAGVMTPKEDQIADHQSTALIEHFDVYESSLRSRGLTNAHRKETRRCLDRLAEECLFRRLSDIQRGPLENGSLKSRHKACRRGRGTPIKGPRFHSATGAWKVAGLPSTHSKGCQRRTRKRTAAVNAVR